MATINDATRVVFWIGGNGFLVSAANAATLTGILSVAPIVSKFYDSENRDAPAIRHAKETGEFTVTQVDRKGILSLADGELYDRKSAIRSNAGYAQREANKARAASNGAAESEALARLDECEAEALKLGFKLETANRDAEWPDFKLSKIVSND